jgi:hypothetical protein
MDSCVAIGLAIAAELLELESSAEAFKSFAAAVRAGC